MWVSLIIIVKLLIIVAVLIVMFINIGINLIGVAFVSLKGMQLRVGPQIVGVWELAGWANILFGIGAVLAEESEAMTIIANKPVHSVFYLICVFVIASAMLILLDVEFLAIIFLLVYVGAVSILFLFVVMMFNINLVGLMEVIRKKYYVSSTI